MGSSGKAGGAGEDVNNVVVVFYIIADYSVITQAGLTFFSLSPGVHFTRPQTIGLERFCAVELKICRFLE